MHSDLSVSCFSKGHACFNIFTLINLSKNLRMIQIILRRTNFNTHTIYLYKKVFLNMITANNMFPLQINFALMFPSLTLAVLN
jgi:hypothetical protein